MLRTVIAAAAGLLLLAGCGSDPPRPGPQIRLTIEEPTDRAVVHESTVEISGRVAPRGTTIMVEGRPVTVARGRFSATVDLAPGTNLVDVLAGREGSIPAMVALRVRREVDVRIPELGGASPSDAEDALAALGLEADIQKAGGILELLLPEDARVCGTDPEAGSLVPPGTTVTVDVAKAC